MKAAISDEDAIITAYRAHGWTYMMGVPVLGVLAELAGMFLTRHQTARVSYDSLYRFTTKVWFLRGR